MAEPREQFPDAAHAERHAGYVHDGQIGLLEDRHGPRRPTSSLLCFGRADRRSADGKAGCIAAPRGPEHWSAFRRRRQGDGGHRRCCVPPRRPIGMEARRKRRDACAWRMHASRRQVNHDALQALRRRLQEGREEGRDVDFRHVHELPQDAGVHRAGSNEPLNLCVGEAVAGRPSKRRVVGSHGCAIPAAMAEQPPTAK